MDEISIKDVLDCVGENINPARDILGVPSSGIELKTNADGSIDNAVVDTTEFRLTKSYFENLGILMTEYLATTTLGDLQRKSREANINNNAADTNNANASSIRSSIGEVNQ